MVLVLIVKTKRGKGKQHPPRLKLSRCFHRCPFIALNWNSSVVRPLSCHPRDGETKACIKGHTVGMWLRFDLNCILIQFSLILTAKCLLERVKVRIARESRFILLWRDKLRNVCNSLPCARVTCCPEIYSCPNHSYLVDFLVSNWKNLICSLLLQWAPDLGDIPAVMFCVAGTFEPQALWPENVRGYRS